MEVETNARRYRMLIDDGDVALLRGYTPYLGTNGYWYISTNRTGPITVHSLVAGGAVNGQHIDHANGDKNDNRKSNLRFVTPSANQVNRKALNKNNTSGARGVRYRGDGFTNPWLATIGIDRKLKHIGVFPTKELAVEARKQAEIKHYGEECP